MSPPELNALLLVAAVGLDENVNKYGNHAPSAGSEYVFSLDKGVDLWVLKVFRPQGYISYGNLRLMITGLQMYMVLGKRPWAIKFRVLYGPNNFDLGHGAVGNLWPPDPPSNTTLKRGIQSSSVSLNAASLSSIAPDSTSTNWSHIASSLLTTQSPNSSLPGAGKGPIRFKVPDTEMTLALTRKNLYIDFFTLQALLTGANDSIYQQLDLHGASALIAGRNFRYFLEDRRVVLEVLSWQSLPSTGLTWGQLAEVVEGLALFVVEGPYHNACFFDVLEGDPEATIGVGKIAPSLALAE